MFEMEYTPKRTVCKVTFKIPGEWAQNEAAVVGTFNDWDPKADPMEKKDGMWEARVRLKPETEYRFKYLLDGTHWRNDDAATHYIPNEYNSKDSILKTGT